MKKLTIVLILLMATSAFGAGPCGWYNLSGDWVMSDAVEPCGVETIGNAKAITLDIETNYNDYSRYIGCKVERVTDGKEGTVVGLTEPSENGTRWFKINHEICIELPANTITNFKDVGEQYCETLKKTISLNEFLSQWRVVE